MTGTMRAAAQRLDLPPDPASGATLAPAFGRRFAIFADAEEEFDWGRPFSREAVSVRAVAALPDANQHLRALGGFVTYMVDHPVVADPAAAAAVRAMVAEGEAGIGTQLHPWVNPPFEEMLGRRNSFVGNLPEALERAKLAALTDLIADRIGVRPIAYRAGRYGVGPHSGELLRDAGYRLDVSVRALFDYSDEGGPDFRSMPIAPWWVAPDLLEVPLTAAYIGGARRWGATLYRHKRLRGPLSRLGLLSRIALTPEGIPLREAQEAVRILLGEGHRLFSLSFHTPSVERGHTPYVRDAADLRHFWAWWEGMLGLFAREGVAACGVADILAAAD